MASTSLPASLPTYLPTPLIASAETWWGHTLLPVRSRSSKLAPGCTLYTISKTERELHSVTTVGRKMDERVGSDEARLLRVLDDPASVVDGEGCYLISPDGA